MTRVGTSFVTKAVAEGCTVDPMTARDHLSGAQFGEFTPVPQEEYERFRNARPAFATARELVTHAVPADLGLRERDGKMYQMNPSEHDDPLRVMERKYASAEKTGLVEHIKEHGVMHPIRMVPDGAYGPHQQWDDEHRVPLIWNGQHRVAVMLKHDPDKPLPLDWDSFEGFEDRGPKKNRAYGVKKPDAPSPLAQPPKKRGKKP